LLFLPAFFMLAAAAAEHTVEIALLRELVKLAAEMVIIKETVEMPQLILGQAAAEVVILVQTM
jgi:hypothetical protein